MTHLSHFGLEIIGQTSDNVIFEVTLANCKRMAFAHGMEIEKYEGRILGMDGGKAHVAVADASDFVRIVFNESGMIQKTRDAWALVMPVRVWEND